MPAVGRLWPSGDDDVGDDDVSGGGGGDDVGDYDVSGSGDDDDDVGDGDVSVMVMMMIRRKGKESHGSLCSAIRRQSPENVDINQVILHRYLIMKSYFVFSLTARSPGSS